MNPGTERTKALDVRVLRRRIDEVDRKLLGLLNKRLGIASSIGKLKGRRRLGAYVPSREHEVYERLRRINRGPLPDEALRAIYREVMSATLAAQQPVAVAYLGPEASFTHLASRSKFGSSVMYLPVRSIADVFTEVERGRADYGVVPIENSTEGVVNHTLDMFIDSDLLICAEIQLEVRQNLLARCRLEEIRRVVSHAQALAQCRVWLEENLPGVELGEVSSTAEASRLAASRRGVAAIGTDLAASLYGLKVLASNIQDVAANFTRFLVIGKTENEVTGHDRTSIMLSIRDRVGALHAMLDPFRKHRINLTMIESRPSRRRAWDYYFFVDFEGHSKERRVEKVLRELEKQCLFLKILGSYPVAT